MTRNSETIFGVRPPQSTVSLLVISAVGLLLGIGFDIQAQFGFSQKLAVGIVLGFGLGFLLLQLRDQVVISNDTLTITHGIKSEVWHYEMLNRISFCMSFAKRGLFFSPLQIEIRAKLIDQEKEIIICSSALYGVRRMGLVFNHIHKFNPDKVVVRFFFGPENSVSDKITDGDRFAEKTIEIVRRKIRRGFIFAGVWLSVVLILSVAHHSFDMFLFYFCAFILFFGLVFLGLFLSKRMVIPPSRLLAASPAGLAGC